MKFIEYVEQEKAKARLENIKEVRKDIKKSWVSEKIYKHINCFDGLFQYSDIENEIMTNDVVASFFAKDPSKQNISEKLAAKVLGTETLPQAGVNSIRFNDAGDIVHTSIGNTKAVDFMLNGVYATQKYTTDKGGAQDNQRNDVIDFLKRGSIKHKVMAIVDGEYWEEYRPMLTQMFADNPNVVITSVDELTGEN